MGNNEREKEEKKRMASREEATEERSGGGAGGKLARRPFRRMAQPTPYDRPPRTAAASAGEEGQGGWLSGLLIRPVSRLLPSLFSSSSSPRPPHSPPSPEDEREGFDGVSTMVSDNQFEESTASDASAESECPFAGPEADKLLENKVTNACDWNGLAEIEQRLKQKMFSRDETNRLIELLKSRTTDLPNDDGHAGGFIAEATEGTLGPQDLITSGELALQSDYRMTPKIFYSHHAEAHGAGSSPVEIARAYMESLTSASDHDSQSGKSKIVKNSVGNDISSPKLPQSAAKAPICWPGAVVPSNHYYLTPQTQRGRTGLRNFPRMPYSGSMFSRSTSKFQGGGECCKISLAGWNQASTSVFGSDMVVKRTLDDGLASVGPVHQIHQKNVPNACIATAPSGFAATFSLPSGPPEKGASEGTLLEFQSAKANDEISRYMVGSSTVHPQSSATACKILRHLERTVPSAEEKSLDLKLDIAGMEVPSMPSTPVMGGQGDRFNVSVYGDQKPGGLFGRDIGEQEHVDAEKVLPGLYMSKNHEDKLLSSPSQSSQQGNTTAGSEVFQIPRPVHHSSGFKPALSSLFTTNPTSESSDIGCSFTFPVSVASNSFSEPPPTPTITKSQAVSRMSRNSEGSVPSFSFGSSTVDSGLVFSFGSIASSTLTETATPGFKFGSNENRRLSFKSLSSDAICY
uniref:Uncharacterized protein LOC105033984 n=1 Tax=Elaeis guineensis var. tenera TaxID=51953 RepID=A0A6I9QEF3_ELAGV|nr:uncharacterized protein LOC105033984 [Elaeis guineensis]